MIQEKIKIYADIIEKQYLKEIKQIKCIDVTAINSPLFIFDGLHYYLFIGSLQRNRNTDKPIDINLRNLQGETINFWWDVVDPQTDHPQFNEICILFDYAQDNKNNIVLSGTIVEYEII
jgi:hypothetical protein